MNSIPSRAPMPAIIYADTSVLNQNRMREYLKRLGAFIYDHEKGLFYDN